MNGERESLFAVTVRAVADEIDACVIECGFVAGSSTAYWTGAEDALKWVLGLESLPPSEQAGLGGDDEDSDDDDA